MAPVVEVRALRKQYGRTVAVADVSFEVEAGQIFGLLGPNGSGKTTTVECLQGLRRPNAGCIRVFGLDPATEARKVRRLVGSQLQDSALPDRLRVGEALELFAAISPGGPPWEQLLDEWGLADRRHAAFAELSGGQRQRLFVALALVSDPKLVVLDEMTTGLDPAARRVAWDLVSAVRDRGTTVVLVTHFMDEAQRLCDRMAILSQGRVLAEGTAAELVAARQVETVVRFTAPAEADVTCLHSLAGVRTVERTGDEVVVRGTGPLLARVAHAVVERGMEPEDLSVQLPTLEDAYLALTRTDGAGEAV
ncbi:MAG TPA: ABC transporter ATP-binding protein [Actinomycetales bacterium]|nr:ABC transporter ATP-binding protein [Actinomycetales bacterium]